MSFWVTVSVYCLRPNLLPLNASFLVTGRVFSAREVAMLPLGKAFPASVVAQEQEEQAETLEGVHMPLSSGYASPQVGRFWRTWWRLCFKH